MDAFSLEGILADFDPKDPTSDPHHRRPVTLWLPPEEKDRYDRLQKLSHKRFGQKAREALIALMAVAEKKIG